MHRPPGGRGVCGAQHSPSVGAGARVAKDCHAHAHAHAHAEDHRGLGPEGVLDHRPLRGWQPPAHQQQYRGSLGGGGRHGPWCTGPAAAAWVPMGTDALDEGGGGHSGRPAYAQPLPPPPPPNPKCLRPLPLVRGSIKKKKGSWALGLDRRVVATMGQSSYAPPPKAVPGNRGSKSETSLGDNPVPQSNDFTTGAGRPISHIWGMPCE